VRVDAERLQGRVAGVVAGVVGETPRSGDRLAADSLSHTELVLALEDEFGVRLPDDANLATLEGASEEVAAVMGAHPESSGPLADGIGRLAWLGEGVLRPVLRAAYRFRVRGADRIPPSGPAVLASNHDSLLDIPILAVATPRPVWFMAKAELFKGSFSSWFFHVLGGFPVRRAGYDLAAVRAALAVIGSGRLLGMYPEGTRASFLQAFLPGAAWVALATGVPLVPVGITGTAQAMPGGSVLPRRSRVVISFGEPMEIEREDDARARLRRARDVTGSLRSEVERLLASG
jgi:1-acyl-sn-glycerol-3-phosphate acyltransferase